MLSNLSKTTMSLSRRANFPSMRIPSMGGAISLQTRNLLLYINNDSSTQDPKAINAQWSQAALDADGMGCDPAPHFRRFYMKPKEMRKMRVNKRRGREAYHKVKAIADLVEFKRTMKFN